MVFYQWSVVAAIFLVLPGATGGKRAPYFVQEPENVVAAKGSPLTLNCSADGLPKPDIEWYKDGRRLALDSRRLQLNSGALHFTRVISERSNQPDVGTYYCLARNVQGVIISGTVAVKVAALSKKFLEQPQNTTVLQGRNVRFACRVVKGVPVVTVAWEKDGILLNRSNPKLTLLPQGILQISNTQWSDEGNYRCILSNGFRQRQSQYGSLKVVAGTPTKTYGPHLLAPTVNMTVTEGQDAVLECFAKGFPLPTLSWKRLGKVFQISQHPIQQSRRMGVFNWNMRSVSRKDEGSYQCSATLAGRTVTASVWLFVKALPHFLSKPVDTRLEYGRTVTLSCKADGFPLPKMKWFKNGNAVQQGNRVLILHKETSTTMQISGVQYEDSGSYQCFAENQLASIQATASLEVQMPDNQPGPAQDVVAQVVSSFSIHLTWSPPLVGNSGLVAYTLYCKDLDHVDIQEFEVVLDEKDRSYNFKDLHGYTNYSLHIVAFGKGIGLPSKTVTVRTRTGKPSAPPFNLSAVSSKERNTLDVRWVQPPTLLLNGLVTWYIIQYKEVHSDTLGTQNVPGSLQHTVITGLRQGATYTLKVAATTSEGAGPFCEVVQATVLAANDTFSTKPPPARCIPAPPQNVSCSPQGSDSLRVTWEKPLIQKSGTSYKVSYQMKGSSFVEQRDVNEEVFLLDGLHSAKVYTILVKPAHACVLLLETVEKECQTDKAEPRSVPSNLVVTFQTSTRVHIDCHRPAQFHGDIKRYDVLYSRDRTLPFKRWKKGPVTMFTFRDKCEADLSGLLPNATYFLCIRLVTNKGVGPLSQLCTIPMQLSDVARKPPPDAKVTRRSIRSVEVSWPVLSDAQGKLEGYTLLYSHYPKFAQWKEKHINMNFVLGGKTRLSMSLDLEFGKTYNIWLRAEFSHNISGLWRKKTFTMGYLNPTSVAPGVHSPKQEEKSAEGDFAVKLGIIIGCIISAFFTVVLVLFIIWRNPCRYQRQQVCRDRSDQSMNAFLRAPVALQMSVSGSQGHSSSYEEGSFSSGVCQCRCTCGASRRVPSSYAFKPVNQAVERQTTPRPSARGYLQSRPSQAKASNAKTRHQTDSKDLAATSSSSVSAENSSDSRTRANNVSRLQARSVDV